MFKIGEELILNYFKTENINSLEKYRYNLNKIIKRKKEIKRIMKVKKDLEEFNRAFEQ